MQTAYFYRKADQYNRTLGAKDIAFSSTTERHWFRSGWHGWGKTLKAIGGNSFSQHAIKISTLNFTPTNRLKDEFLATVTHELHAPLVAILGWTRLLRSNQLDRSTASRALDTIERSANNQAKLIKDLLDISTILSGKVYLDRQPVNLTSTLKEVIHTMLSDAQAKRIQIVEAFNLTSVEKDICVCGDLIRLQQVFSKLLHNAIKFTPKGGSVEVQLDALDSWATISISDTGIGISADFLPYVFDRFTQEEVPSRRLPGGLGLGLAIARQLVELHDGTIEAASEGVGRGATFTVKLLLAVIPDLFENWET